MCIRDRHLTVGDYAVLVSDGLLVDGPGWVAKQLELSAAAGEAPEKVAKTLVEMCIRDSPCGGCR